MGLDGSDESDGSDEKRPPMVPQNLHLDQFININVFFILTSIIHYDLFFLFDTIASPGGSGSVSGRLIGYIDLCELAFYQMIAEDVLKK